MSVSLRIAPLVFVAAVVQVTVLGGTRLLWAEPDLLLVTIVCIALAAGAIPGAAAGFAGGLLVDIMTLGTLGLTSLVLTLAGYWAGRYGETTGRGRTHAPLPKIPRTVFAFCAPFPVVSAETLAKGLECVTAEDTRWARCDIKSVSLLANILLRQLSVDANAAETILLRDGDLVEASASAVHVVIVGELRSPPNSRRLLPGTTRSVIEELAERAEIPCVSIPVSEAELRSAQEICLTAATREIQPVTRLDGKPVGTGQPGPIWKRLHEQMQRFKREIANQPW